MQAPDGSFRSDTYGSMYDGVALTPAVMKTLMLGPVTDQSEAAVARAAGWLGGQSGADLEYPVYTAAVAAIVFQRLGDEAAAEAWLAVLKKYQLTEALRWREEDLAYGGWGYSVQPPFRGDEPGPFEADLSSTLFAVGALRLCGVAADDPAFAEALVFVERCQNLGEPSDPAYSDGGFFFAPSREAQNKAGVAGIDRHGQVRFNSYGSATADGVRALLRCGLAPDHPRLVDARRWLRRNFSAQTNPGRFEPAVAADREAGYFYWCWSVSHTFALLPETGLQWREPLVEALLARQRPDGSWRNEYSFMREDDPIIATVLAAAALTASRRAAP